MDSSAVIAVLLSEDGYERIEAALFGARSLKMSVANWLEASLVVDGRESPHLSREFDDFTDRFKIELVPVDVDQIEWARIANQTYGRGYHSAKLNFGDCFAYALARSTGEPLLFKGRDFAQTDIEPALST